VVHVHTCTQKHAAWPELAIEVIKLFSGLFIQGAEVQRQYVHLLMCRGNILTI